MKVDIGYVKSNKPQVCRICGKIIPARVESVKYTKKKQGRVSLTETWYICMSCEKKGQEFKESKKNV